MLAAALLVVGVAGAVGRPRGIPAWVVPAACAAVALAAGTLDHPATALRPLAAPLAFLLLAVPLAALLDRLGVFGAAAALCGRGRHLVLGLWVLAALVTAVLNLDAAVVLLTPLYVQIARRAGLDVPALAFQPVLLSCLASSALPVSNLTNLIAASGRHLGSVAFVGHLGLPTLAAVTVGWFAYARVFPPRPPAVALNDASDRDALAIGGVVLVVLLAGFVLGPGAGVPEWATVLGVDLVLVALARHVPVRDVPLGAALVAGSLALLALGAADHVDLAATFAGSGNLDLVRIGSVGAVGANVVNNLPALLVGLRWTHSGDGVWALLLGVNIGPVVLVTGSLAALLWQATLARLDVRVSAREYARVGVRVGLPALVAALVVLLALRPLGG
ncbi:MAG: Citrate transporter [Acidimicrobiales bacterium]|nr:Citrate transporter [Acidimicrobiales bacterium]